MTIPLMAKYLADLHPPDRDWGGMGSLPLTHDARDYSMSRLPGVKGAIEAGLPSSADMSADFKRIYNQGSEPSCVAFSSCGLTSAFDWLADQGWDDLDGHRLYRACGGDGSNGIDSRVALEYVRTTGAPLLSGAGSLKVGSYVFASREPQQFRQDVAAALAAGHFCTVALLLPSNWGWSSSGSITSGYHQTVAAGYTGLGDNDWVILVNSWGEQWGQRGVGRVTWGYLLQNSLMNGYVYAFAVTPLVLPKPDPPPPPPPPPARAATVRGRAQAGATNGVWPAVGDAVPFGVNVTLTVQEITFDGEPTPDPGPQPEPAPGELTVTFRMRQLGSYLTVFVYVAGKAEAGTFDAEAGVARVICRVAGLVDSQQGVAALNGQPAGFRFARVPAGTVVTAMATLGEHSGSATEPAP